MLNRLRAWNINAKFSYALIRQLAAKQYLAGTGRRWPSKGILLNALSVERVGRFGSRVRGTTLEFSLLRARERPAHY